jgi:ribonuclease-3
VGESSIAVLERRFGRSFKNRSLIEEALTHSSAASGVSNERLEFLGDAVLQLTVSRHLYKKFPTHSEGKLTKLRAKVVNKKTLAQVALRCGMDELLIVGDSLKKSEDSPNDSILADAYEALIGAVYLDLGMKSVSRFVRVTLLEELENIKLSRDFKSELQEKVVKAFKCYPSYKLIKAKGPEHAKRFWVEVRVKGRRFGVGQGLTIKEAEKEAAMRSLRNWGKREARGKGR